MLANLKLLSVVILSSIASGCKTCYHVAHLMCFCGSVLFRTLYLNLFSSDLFRQHGITLIDL